MTTDVYLTRTASYLPFEPVGNEEVESVLGLIGGKPSRSRRIVLRSNGITSRHYALDRATGRPAMSNARLTAEAVRALGDTGPVDLLATGTSLPDQLLPGHASMVHGELGWPRLETVSCGGVCLSGISALKHAWLAVRAGTAERAVATGSELVSPLLRAEHFAPEFDEKLAQLERNPEIAFEKEFLRWMLSDGAGAMLLENAPRGPLSLRVDWIHMTSAAHELPACMYAGADRHGGGEALRGWMDYAAGEWAPASVFAIKQDVRLLNDHIVPATLGAPMKLLMDRYALKPERVDWFLPHLSSLFFADRVAQCMEEVGLPIPRERWFTNLATKGNTGSASPFIMLDELLRSGRVKPGHRLLMGVPESGRFAGGVVHMEAV